MMRDTQTFFGMETPLRERSGGHAGTAPTVSFGEIARGTVDFVWVDCVQMVILFVWAAWKNIMEIGRGGACVPARVALQGHIHRSIPHAQCVYFWYGNAAMRTFGRAHRHRPYAFCLRELRVDVRPYDFIWADGVWM